MKTGKEKRNEVFEGIQLMLMNVFIISIILECREQRIINVISKTDPLAHSLNGFFPEYYFPLIIIASTVLSALLLNSRRWKFSRRLGLVILLLAPVLQLLSIIILNLIGYL